MEAGLVYGLKQHGVDVVRYALDGRLTGAAKWLFNAFIGYQVTIFDTLNSKTDA